MHGTPGASDADFCNACINYFYGAQEELWTDRVHPALPEEYQGNEAGVPDRVQIELRSGGAQGPGTAVDVEVANQTVKAWRLYADYPPQQGKFGEDAGGLELAYWYLFPPDTPAQEPGAPVVWSERLRRP